MSRQNRRQFLKATGTALAGAAVASAPGAAASGESKRFLIDLREVDRSAVPADVEIVHDIGEIDVLAARGDPDAVPGEASTALDVSVYRHGVDADSLRDPNDGAGPDDGDDEDERGGPAKEHGPATESPGELDGGPPTYNELQWDKRAQHLADLTEVEGVGPDDDQSDVPLPGTVHSVTRGEGARVAVLDSGIYADHPDLRGVVNESLSRNFTTDQYDWRPNGAGTHGTHVAGIVAGTDSNDGDRGGILGSAPASELLSLRVFSGVEGKSGDVLAALVYAAGAGCDAANLSLGYPKPYVYPEKYPELLKIAELYERAVSHARSRGTVVVNSTGNGSLDMSPESVLSLPTEVPGVFGVSATGPVGFLWDDDPPNEEFALLPGKLSEPTDQPARYTNYGHGTDVSAAGGNYDPAAVDGDEEWYYDLVISTVFETAADGTVTPSYGWKAGTSMAAPQVAGAVALVRSLQADASVDEVESLVRETAVDGDGTEAYHGSGHLSLPRLVFAAWAGSTDGGFGNGSDGEDGRGSEGGDGWGGEDGGDWGSDDGGENESETGG
ncbi:S8 family peptidase [Halobaculum sp. D14]|uniref:S8 family peptidase n=1 Tax=unclassified Halobaculum TaxID=2640896 RepID=UPI003EBD10CA